MLRISELTSSACQHVILSACLRVCLSACSGSNSTIKLFGERTNGEYSDMRKHVLAGSNGWVTYL